MAVDFEAAAQALFDRLNTAGGFQFATRIAENWDDVPPPATPALMLCSDAIDPWDPPSTIAGQTPPMFKMSLDAIIYVQNLDPAIAPAIALNQALARVVNALLVQPGEANGGVGRPFPQPWGARSTTLGGLCAGCRIAGKIVLADGTLGGRAAAKFPIEMVLTT